jgi:hypothetical protein
LIAALLAIAMQCQVRDAPDVELRQAAADACRQAAAEYRQLLGSAAPRATMTFRKSQTLSYTADRHGAGLLIPRPETPLDSAYWRQAIPHELGHAMYISARGRPWAYGPGRGDWFFEGVAMWAEGQNARNERLWTAKALATPISLSQLLAMAHPLQDDRTPAVEGTIEVRICDSPCAERPKGPDTLILHTYRTKSGAMRIDTLPPSSPYVYANAIAAQYYPLTMSVMCFIRQRGGASAIRRVRSRIERRAPGNVIENLPNLPSTAEGFEDAWWAWLQTARECTS